MKTTLTYALLLGLLVSCNGTRSSEDTNDLDYLIFGHFYGRCMGETCVETFKLTEKHLFEDTLDDHSGEDFKFIPLEKEQFEQVKHLPLMFPVQLINETETVLGCPDCSDGGGLFIQLSREGTVYQWRIDQNKGNVPSYLHPFMDQVNAKIKLLNAEKQAKLSSHQKING